MPLDTVPSLMTVAAVGRRQRSLRASIVFHPDLSRVGRHVDLATWPETESRPRFEALIGRSLPLFSDGQPLDEPHVSREALRIRSEKSGMSAARGSEAAVCRIGPEELDRYPLTDAALQKGVPIRLGHGVVLFVREVVLPASAPEVNAEAYPGCSVETQSVRQLIAAAAGSDLSVLLLGETGVGKELVARAIHVASPRADRPLVCINVAGIPESVAAAELFGTERGAYTDAEPRAGHFRSAHRGTLFLDEIGDTPLQVQAQLLRALQEREIQVLGGRSVAVDVRVVAATDAEIDADSGFRAALRHRLAGITIQIRPLRERPEDIGPQVLQMLTLAGADHPSAPLADLMTNSRVAAWWARFFFDLTLGDWPGNSRELQQTVERLLLRADDAWDYEVVPNERSDEDDTKAKLAQAYADCDFEPTATAVALGMSRGSLYRLLKAAPDCRIASEVPDSELDAAISEVGQDPARLGRYLRVSARGLMPRLALRGRERQ